MSWLLHTRRVPLVDGSANAVPQRPATGAAEAAFSCAGVGCEDALVWMCHDCISDLCVAEEQLLCMPPTALSNLLWLGREHPRIQDASLGTKLLLGLGRPCFRKLFLGKGQRENLQQGLTGNSVLVAQPRADLASLLPPTSGNLLNHFVVIYGKSIEDVAKSQVLKVQRSAYEELLAVRTVTNEAFAELPRDETAIAQLPEDGVPQQFIDCAVHMDESDKFQVSRPGPATRPHDCGTGGDSDAEEEEVARDDPENEDDITEDAKEAATPVDDTNQCETPLGFDPTAAPSVTQLMIAFKTKLSLLQQAQTLQSTLESAAPDTSQHTDMNTVAARAAQREVCQRAAIDVNLAAKKLSALDFEKQGEFLEEAAKPVFVPGCEALSMFDPLTWTRCFSEFWFGDCLPNDKKRPRPVSFEVLFPALMDREELSYDLPSDKTGYCPSPRSRFDTPEHILVFGDSLRRLRMFRGARLALKRKGFQTDVAVIAKATAADCEKALETENNRSKGVEALAALSTLPKGLVAALRQVLVSTAEVPFTDGYRRALRHEGHNLNIVHGSLKVFATGNYADTYSSITRMLAQGSVEQPVEECDDPTMPSLQALHRLVASSPRAQAKFFLLMDDIVDVHMLGMDGCSVGRLGRANYKHREDELASSGTTPPTE